LISLNPFVAEGQTITDPALAGVWKGSAEEVDTVTIQPKGALYALHYSDGKSESMDFEGRLARVGDAEVLDLITTQDSGFAVPVHMLIRLWPEAGKLKFAYLQSDWLRQQAKRSLATQESHERTLITTQGDAVVQFLKKFGGDARAYSGDLTEMVKAK
jgi:hypothetical protein